MEHISEELAIGTGEIIDAESRPAEARNQIDIVLYKRNFPKINFGGGVNGFLVESVVATIEVKSVLDKKGLEDAIKAARAIKSLKRNVVNVISSGYQPPSILNFVVAYDGPVSMRTILDWIPLIHESLNISPYPEKWPVADRLQAASPSIDGVFVLGKGFLHFDNSPLHFPLSSELDNNFLLKWVGANTDRNNLFLLFMLLTAALSNVSTSWFNCYPYVQGRSFYDSKETFYLGVPNQAELPQLP